MKKQILLALLLLLNVLPGRGQSSLRRSYADGSYQTGVGIRFGNTNGLSVKHFLDGRKAVEGILSARWGGLGVTGLLEWHKEAFQTPGLNFFYGVGGHLYTGRYRYRARYESNSALGVDGIVGLEYHLPRAPFTGTLDWKPALNLIGRSSFSGGGLALTVRYTF
jgi:hypothetical protein